MADYYGILSEIKGKIALLCVGGMDAPELIRAADAAVRENAPAIAARDEYVGMLWSWLEKTGVEIYSRLYSGAADGIAPGAGGALPDDIADLPGEIVGKIKSAFKAGAGGVQLMVAKESLGAVSSALFSVAGNLFVNRKLVIGLDFGAVDYFDWEEIFYQLNKISAHGILLDAAHPAKRKADDSVGRLYGFFDSMPHGFGGQVQFSGLDAAAAEAAMRLCRKMRPDVSDNLRFFMDFSASQPLS
jgi:hypothetical protein